MSVEEILQSAGDVLIEKILLISSSGKIVSIADYLIELNIYESIFNPSLSGTLTLGDSSNLIKTLPIIGDELLLLEIKTPTLNSKISRTFRIYSIQDKTYSTDGSAHVYNLEFCSAEAFRDISNPIFKSFDGEAHTLVQQIYDDYLKGPRTLSEQGEESSSELFILTNGSNKLKFVSPGWSPIQCINWIASRSESSNGKACNFLFWETTKAFYFGTIETIFSNTLNASAGKYHYSASKVGRDIMNVQEHMFDIRSLNVNKTLDNMNNKMNGYLSSRLIDVNLFEKSFENKDYDHRREFYSYRHTEGENSKPFFAIDTSAEPKVYQRVNYNYPKLYNDCENNFCERYKFIFSNRRSNLLELSNFDMTITIPGRTDIEVGSLIDITLPKVNLTNIEDKTEKGIDEQYSGYYLITSINHKINTITHHITATLTKDCLPSQYNYAS